MSDFLLELRSEEIPARMQAGARANLARLFRAETAAGGLVLDGDHPLTVWSTPRRLALLIKDLPLATATVSEEIKGPRTNTPGQALDGFLRKTGMAREQLVERDGVWFARIERPGRATAAVLAQAIPAIIRSFPWPKSMRWGAASRSTTSLRWVRPLSGIVALLDDAVIPFAIDGMCAGRTTHGHRFHGAGAFTVTRPDSYAAQLRAHHVIVDHTAREAIIREQGADAARAAGLVLVADEGLVIENAGLTEWPVPLLGRFDAGFLTVPPEVIQLTARSNQKYFICRDGAGMLANAFICTANIVAADGGAAIVAGNRKVLTARLADARFFWDQDRKKTLAQHAAGLARITFHEKLGTVADKVERVARLARWLATDGIVPGADPDVAEQAARLCKADLVTEMVGEFPELQGLVGGCYARAERLPDAVADAIRDHYQPVGQGDAVPTAPVTVAVSLADKLDSLIQFFDKNIRPTGSKDPFALRRAALGIVSIIVSNRLRVSLRDVFATQQLEGSSGISLHQTREFFIDRLKVQQMDAGIRHDLIDAVCGLPDVDFDLVGLLARITALQSFLYAQDGMNLLAGYRRAANILKKEGFTAPLPLGGGGFSLEPAEAALIAAIDIAAPRAEAAILAEDFTGAMAALAALRAPIDDFFENVTVNDPDPARRAARLGLLDRFRAAVHKVADFSLIEG